MDWEKIIKKITSRKFWVAVAGLVAGIILAFKGDAETAETISGCIMMIASIVSYIFGEGLADAAGAKEDNEKLK